MSDPLTPGEAMLIDAAAQVCDVCGGDGHEHLPDGRVEECHLCEGAGWFDADGFPLADDED
jgi:DnaJ-class molecular chaperone